MAAIAAGLTGLVVSQFDAPGYTRSAPDTGDMAGMQGMPSMGGNVAQPRLTGLAVDGKELFQANCAACHGKWGGGTDQGPSLIQDTYKTRLHGDMAFVLAFRNGVRQHHRRFGNMPPQPQIKFEAAQAIIAFVRSVQVANGIK